MSRHNGPLPEPAPRQSAEVEYLDALAASADALREALAGLDFAVSRLDRCLALHAKLKADHANPA